MSFETLDAIPSPTGATLALRRQPAETKPIGILLVNHGLAEHSGRYARFAAVMAGHGFHVYAHDHRGHGHTKAPDAPLGSFGKGKAAEKVLADVAAIHALAAKEHPNLPVVVFGHSMGGPIALNHVLRHGDRVRAAAIWNANLRAGLAARTARLILAWEKFRLGSDVPSRILPKLTFEAWAKAVPDRRTDFDWLSRDAAEVDRYIADPLCGWSPSIGMWQAIFDFSLMASADKAFARLPRTLPFNLVGGQSDPVTGGGKTVTALAERLRGLGFTNLETRVYPETRHEGLNEVNRDLVMHDFSDWAVAAARS